MWNCYAQGILKETRENTNQKKVIWGTGSFSPSETIGKQKEVILFPKSLDSVPSVILVSWNDSENIFDYMSGINVLSYSTTKDSFTVFSNRIKANASARWYFSYLAIME